MTAKITRPIVPADHPNFKWTSGADVQSTWRRFGWKPTFGDAVAPIPPKEVVLDTTKKYWRVK